MNKLLLAPHPDDEVLFAAYTMMREKPVVAILTEATVQQKRGEIGCDAQTRWMESVGSAEILGCPIMRIGIPEDMLTEELAIGFLSKSLANFDVVYIPALQGGHEHHDIVNRAAKAVFGDKCVEYTTYTKTELYTTGDIEIVPTKEEMALKREALKCHGSQLALESTRPHFEAVMNRPEWLNNYV